VFVASVLTQFIWITINCKSSEETLDLAQETWPLPCACCEKLTPLGWTVWPLPLT